MTTIAAGSAARKRMRGFVPFKFSRIGSALSALRQVLTIPNGMDYASTTSSSAMLARTFRRPTLAELNLHPESIDRLPCNLFSVAAIGRRASGDGYGISGDRGVKTAAVARDGAWLQGLLRGPLRVFASRRRKGLAARPTPAVRDWNEMRAMDAMAMTAGSIARS
ncbi:hypothetical protein RB623_10540 [Mesorhizobium sp. LHD-90]|uniref:hypothetical protein n=1 Tax=Mesorhizobium sp. LHD-90 TaxID=3071414 RepID=UPI0027E1DA90|nr:hypothetical protein [Mesorhizobium sp. LHD-90]MDQ6434486.1 hypothetical protein [Mesorhizobium sp. LHD-90]